MNVAEGTVRLLAKEAAIKARVTGRLRTPRSARPLPYAYRGRERSGLDNTPRSLAGRPRRAHGLSLRVRDTARRGGTGFPPGRFRARSIGVPAGELVSTFT